MAYKKKEQPGFVLYAEDWKLLIEVCTGEEIKQLVSAAIDYFETGVITDFEDRAMRIQFSRLARSIDGDIKRFEQKCLLSSYKGYVSACKRKGEEPLEFDDWLTMVNSSQPQSTNTNTNTSENINPNTREKTNTSCGIEDVYRPLSESAFEASRNEKLRLLGY